MFYGGNIFITELLHVVRSWCSYTFTGVHQNCGLTHSHIYLVICYIKIDPHETRGHKFRLMKDTVVKKVRQNFLTERVAYAWSRLPLEVIESPSLNSFLRINKLWKQYRYSQRSIHEQYNYLSAHTDRPNLVTAY